MAGALQPVSMMAAMLEKRLQKPEPDMVALVKNSSAINTLAREASTSCMGLMTWLAPRDDAPAALNTCVAESIGLVTTEISFRGINLVNHTENVDAKVLLSSLRGVFMASLLALTDACDGPSEVVLTSTSSVSVTLLDIRVSPSAGEAMMAGNAPSYRKLEWDDVEALAEAQGVGLSHGPGHVALRFPT